MEQFNAPRIEEPASPDVMCTASPLHYRKLMRCRQYDMGRGRTPALRPLQTILHRNNVKYSVRSENIYPNAQPTVDSPSPHTTG